MIEEFDEERDLLGWLAEPATDRGIRYALPDGSWAFWPYTRVARRTREVAAGLAAAQLPPGGVVALVLRSGPDFVAGLFGTLLAGGVPSPIAPPIAFQDPAHYRDHITTLLRRARPHRVLTEPDLVDRIREFAGPVATRVITSDDLRGPLESAPGWPGCDGSGPALLQYTSGSTGRARGVLVPAGALRANVTAIRRWLRWTSRDPVASWLPVHHDMGLVGCLVPPVVSGADLWLMPPEEFVHRPVRYLRCFGESGARLSAMPTFGLAHIVRRVRPADLRGLDFGGWRAAIIGAEHLDAGTFEQFHALLAPFGLDRRALLPAYGLAEATLAVTGLPLPEQWKAVSIDAAEVALNRPVREGPAAGGHMTVVGCGRPLSGLSVRIVNGDGRTLPDGWVGEIEVRGSSIATGYADEPEEPVTAFADGTLRTGDAGFLLDGQLFVLGRLGDSLKVRGRAVFAEDVEASLADAGLPPRRVAVALGVHRGEPTALAVVEQADPDLLADAAAVLRRRTEGAATVVTVIEVPKGTIPRTSSGKIRRRSIWAAYVDGSLPGPAVTSGRREFEDRQGRPRDDAAQA